MHQQKFGKNVKNCKLIVCVLMSCFPVTHHDWRVLGAEHVALNLGPRSVRRHCCASVPVGWHREALNSKLLQKEQVAATEKTKLVKQVIGMRSKRPTQWRLLQSTSGNYLGHCNCHDEAARFEATCRQSSCDD
jgi:hypothetical protein